MKGRKFGPVLPAGPEDLPGLISRGNGRTVLEAADGVTWQLVGKRSCRKHRWYIHPITGKRTKRTQPAFAQLGLFERPCSTPGCRGVVRARVSLTALGYSFRVGALEITRCAPCRTARADRTPEQRAADRREAQRAASARYYAARKAARGVK